MAPLILQPEIVQCVARCDALYSSPLRRCLVMAQAYAEAQSIVTDARLMEMNFGRWEGMAWSEINRQAMEAWAADIRYYSPPSGESFDGLVKRVQHWLCEVRQQPLSELIVFTHAGVIKSLRVLILGESFADAAMYVAPHHCLETFDL